MPRNLAALFMGATQEGKTPYLVTWGAEWFGWCGDTEERTRVERVNRVSFHIPTQKSSVTAQLLKPAERDQLAALDAKLGEICESTDFTIDCYFGLLLIHTPVELSPAQLVEMCAAMNLRPQPIFDLAAKGVASEAIYALSQRSLSSYFGATNLLEKISQ